MHADVILLEALGAILAWAISTSATLLYLRWRQKAWEQIVTFYVESTSEALSSRIEMLEGNSHRFATEREVSQRLGEIIRDLRELRRMHSELASKYFSGRRG